MLFILSILQHGDDVPRQFDKLRSHHEDIGLFRVAGAFPAFSKDGSKLAFVDNEFKAVWLADSDGMRVVFEVSTPCPFLFFGSKEYKMWRFMTGQ